MDIDITYNQAELRELGKKYPGIVREETVAVMEMIVARLEKEVVERTPRGVGGEAGLAGSIAGEVKGRGSPVTGTVGTPLEYGEVVELGRRPGKAMPPVGPIILWARRKLGVSEEDGEHVGFAIARKIAIEGFEGAKMFESALEDNRRWIQNMLYTIPDRVKKRIGGGT